MTPLSKAVPQIAFDFIAQHEACVLRVYDDARPNKVLAPGDRVTGTLTAGYGHTEYGLMVGQDVTQDMADAWLASDANTAASRLCGVVSADAISCLTDNQYAALISFVFNLGANPTWTIWKRLNAKQFDQVPLEMMKFVNVQIDGQMVKMQGLVNRRAAEVALWATQEPGTSPEVFPSSITRTTATVPTPADPVSMGKSKALLISGAGAVAGAGPMVDQVSHAIQPYATHSHYVQTVLGILATIAALCAGTGIFYIYLQKKAARN